MATAFSTVELLSRCIHVQHGEGRSRNICGTGTRTGTRTCSLRLPLCVVNFVVFLCICSDLCQIPAQAVIRLKEKLSQVAQQSLCIELPEMLDQSPIGASSLSGRLMFGHILSKPDSTLSPGPARNITAPSTICRLKGLRSSPASRMVANATAAHVEEV